MVLRRAPAVAQAPRHRGGINTSFVYNLDVSLAAAAPRRAAGLVARHGVGAREAPLLAGPDVRLRRRVAARDAPEHELLDGVAFEPREHAGLVLEALRDLRRRRDGAGA